MHASPDHAPRRSFAKVAARALAITLALSAWQLPAEAAPAPAKKPVTKQAAKPRAAAPVVRAAPAAPSVSTIKLVPDPAELEHRREREALEDQRHEQLIQGQSQLLAATERAAEASESLLGTLRLLALLGFAGLLLALWTLLRRKPSLRREVSRVPAPPHTPLIAQAPPAAPPPPAAEPAAPAPKASNEKPQRVMPSVS